MYKIIKSLIIVLVVFSSLFFFFYTRSLNRSLINDVNGVDFSIEKGEGVDMVSKKLVEEKIIDSELYFKLYLWKNELDKNLQAGNYRIERGMNLKEIVDIFVSGEVLSKEKEIKIIEGWNLFDIAENFEKNNITSSQEFLSFAENPVDEWVFNFNKPLFLESLPKGHDLEGYVYPDTYRIFENASVPDIIEKALINFDKKITPEMERKIEESGRTLHEVITLASIIEKEVRDDSDKQIVSGILLKRIEVGMKLEVDSTINYITGKNDPGALYSDLEIDSPYNTYKNYGLPPGPITNPGLSSILAAINPVESEYFFYLNRQDTLETIFSKTFEEHINNKNKYLK